MSVIPQNKNSEAINKIIEVMNKIKNGTFKVASSLKDLEGMYQILKL